MSAALSYKEVNIAASLSQQCAITGQVFVCEESTHLFLMQFDDGEKIPCRGGFTIDMRGKGGFRRITFFNTGTDYEAEPLTIRFWAGDATVHYNYVREPQTRLVGYETALADGASFTREGINSGDRRKTFIITNGSNAGRLCIIDTSDGSTTIGCVFAQSSWVIETDADLLIRNPSAGSEDPIDVYIAEIFYVT